MSPDLSKRKNLGRGLSALFGERGESEAPTVVVHAPVALVAAASTLSVTRLPLDLLAPSSLQPRRHFDEAALNELSASIAEKGVLQPLLVRVDPQRPGRYEIIAGERRWRASQRAQVHEVPVHVTNLSDAEVLEVALIENLQRQDLTAVEEARGYKRLVDDFGHTQERVAEVVGKSRAHVTNILRLLTLPRAVQDLLDNGQMTIGQARPLIGLSDAEAAAKLIVKRGMSARQAERFAKGFGRKRRLALVAKDTDTAALEQSLGQATGYKVNIAFDGKGGTVSVTYTRLEQLDDIVRRLSSGGRPEGRADEDLAQAS
jgi:ParB family transcriptional regulator, chromosome partitioning protein